MKKPKAPQIVIVMEGGVIQNIVKRGEARKIKIQVRDFDIEDVEMTRPFKKTPDGEEFIESIW